MAQLSERSQLTSSPKDKLTINAQSDDHGEAHSPNPIFRLKSVKGREGQDVHLFRATLASTQDFNWENYGPEVDEEVPQVPEIPAQFKPESDELQGSAVDKDHDGDDRDNVRNWTTQQVAAWMYNSGFENSIISTFKTHDINGAILLDLSFDDLCELDIVSFGKRRQIWNEVNALRNEGCPDPLKASAVVKDERSCNLYTSFGNHQERSRRPGFDRPGTVTGYRKPSRTTTNSFSNKQQCTLEIPRPHRCSKGERCPKWKQQQCIIAEVDREHGPNTPPSGKFELSSARPRKDLPPLAEPGPVSERPGTPPPSERTASTGPKRTFDDPVPPVPPLPIHDSAQASTTKVQPVPAIDTKHIVQQYQKSAPSSALTLTPETPQWHLFPDPVGKTVSSHPPRQSSLTTLPKLSIPPSPAHSPSSSDSTIRYGEKGSAVSPEATASGKPISSTKFSELAVRPCSPATSARNRSPSPNKSAIAGDYSTDISEHHLRSPSSESDILPGIPPPLFSKDSQDSLIPLPPSRPPVLRSVVSTDAIQRRRNVNPLPTLKEGSLAANQNTERPMKPLPTAPLRTVTDQGRKMSAPEPSRVPSLALAPAPLQSYRNVSPTRHPANRPGKMPPTPRSSTALPTPKSAILPSSRVVNPPNTPATPGSTPSSAVSSVATPTNPSPEPTSYGPEILRVGWVRQRRARLWRHEWVNVHLRLTGTHMTLHTSSRADEKPIEIIRMDEYEVACTSDAGGNKFTAAIRGFRSAGSSKGSSSSTSSVDDSAFTFQLQPTAEMMVAYHNNIRGTNGGVSSPEEEKPAVTATTKDEKGLKIFHFAVRSRDERIEWMRQLMMARALRAKNNTKKAEKDGDVNAARPVTRSGSF